MKNIVVKMLLLIMIFALATGCDSKNSQSEAIEVEEGIDINKEPTRAIKKALEIGKQLGNNDDSAADKEPVEPISFKDLIEYLPKIPQGWQGEKPMGETTSFGSYSISQVSQTYVRDEKEINITIFDWAFNSALYTPFLLTTEFSQESTEGYNKGVKIDDIPGREEYSYQSKKGSLNLLVNSRFLVEIDGTAIEEDELREWWQKIDRQSLTKISARK